MSNEPSELLSEENKATSAPSSGFIFHSYATRHMKTFAIPENELEILSSLNTQATIFYSASSFFISLAISIVLGAAYAGTINQIGKFLLYYGTFSSLIIAVIFFCVAIYNSIKKNNFIKNIKNESKG